MNEAILTMLICLAGGAGTSEQAQPSVDAFLQRFGQVVQGGYRLRGHYFTREAECEASAKGDQPALVVTDPATFVRQRKGWDLRAIAYVGSATAEQYFILAPEGQYRDLAALKGAKIASAVALDASFVDRVVFGGKLPHGDFQLLAMKRPLQVLRSVVDHKADAALVDASTYRNLAELNLPVHLVVVHKSAPLPRWLLSSTAQGRQRSGFVAAVERALPKLCSGGGAKLCQDLGVQAFERVRPDDPFLRAL